MDIFEHFKKTIKDILITEFADTAKLDQTVLDKITVENPRESSHGDLATNVALLLTKILKLPSREIAQRLSSSLKKQSYIKSIEIAGPGFINIKLSPKFWHQKLIEIYQKDINWGESELGKNKTVNIEYVSVNPTGPLHVGHGRGAVFGDSLANLLKKSGFNVVKEYYINDAGSQIDILANSLLLRYKEIVLECTIEIPEGLYPGKYLKDIAQELYLEKGSKLLEYEETKRLKFLKKYSVEKMMNIIKNDLSLLGIHHDVFSSEAELISEDRITNFLENMKDKDLFYKGVLEPPKGKKTDNWEAKEQLLFKSSKFGDDIDRTIQKADGTWTYFASDMVYHMDKISRGADILIDVLGADHGGYIKRIKAIVNAISNNKIEIDVKTCQMVKLIKSGKLIKMSKREGNFILLSDLINEVGADTFRFMMLTRKNDAMLDFDLDKAIEQSKDNPVFYVQYAHARINSVLKHAKSKGIEEINEIEKYNLLSLSDIDELNIIRSLYNYKQVIENAAIKHEPHRICYYIIDLAGQFHSLWNKGQANNELRFIQEDNLEVTHSKLILLRCIKNVLASSLKILGVVPLNELRM